MGYEKGIVSIITPMYKAKNSITQCIESVQNQGYDKIEHIIIDDCSPDESAQIVESLAKKYDSVILIRNQSNCGPAESRNNGIAKAKGQYIAFLDADDYWVGSKLDLQISLLEKSTAPLVCSYYKRFKGEVVTKEIQVPLTLITYRTLLHTNHITTSTVVVNRSVVGEFRMQDYYYDDFVCWLELTKRFGPAVVCPEYLLYYRENNVSVSSDKWRSAKKVWLVYREYLRFSILKSGYYMLFYAYYGFVKHRM